MEKNEDDAKKETERLKRELYDLLGKDELGFADAVKIDEINEKLQQLEPLSDEFSAAEEWKKFEKEFLSGSRTADETKRKKSSAKKRSKAGRLRFLGTAAAVIAAAGVFSTMLVGADLFSGFRSLTEDKVEISSSEGGSSEPEANEFKSFDSVEELEAYLGIELMLPGYLPKGYKPGYVIYSPANSSIVIRYYGSDEDEEIVQIIRRISDGKTITLPKDSTDPYTVVHNNIEFNVYKYNNESFIEWLYNGYSYYISGIREEDLIDKIIEHIE